MVFDHKQVGNVHWTFCKLNKSKLHYLGPVSKQIVKDNPRARVALARGLPWHSNNSYFTDAFTRQLGLP